MNFYKQKKWIRKRENILRRDQYECRECRRYGKTTAATMVHHVYPLDLFPGYGLNSDNLLSLCNRCHEYMHDRVTNAITEKGKQWQTRINLSVDKEQSPLPPS